MAKSKKTKSAADGADEEQAVVPADEEAAPSSPRYVAIKTIKTGTDSERAYAKRESDILSEMVHPNVIHLIRTYDGGSSSGKTTSTYQLCVMTLAHGPNLGTLVLHGGALGLPLSRLVSRHLVAAVGYLHGRGVVNRDVKPENCILVRSDVSSPETFDVNDIRDDEAVWSDGPEGEEAISSDKYKLILVDFGFARALGPDDVGKKGDGNGAVGEDGGASKPKAKAEAPRRRQSRSNRGG